MILAGVALLGCAPKPTETQLQPPAWWGKTFDPQRLAELRRRSAVVTHQVLVHSGHAVNAAAPYVAGPPLAASIRYSRNQARGAQARHIPADIREQLQPYFPEHLLNDVRWTLAGHRLSLGTVLAGWYYTEGAVTLDDVVVFSDPDTAENLWLWAHELTHVQQYEHLGVDGFAARYSRDWPAMERQASTNAFRITAAIREAQAEPRNSDASPPADILAKPVPADPERGAEQAETSSR